MGTGHIDSPVDPGYGLDPIRLEVMWNRLLSVVNEQQAVLMRTAFSTVVRESQDLACGVFDTQGRMVAQSLTGTPGHINAMATGVRHFLAAHPSHTLAPGDVLITNDPWMTAGQINDITVLTPVFDGPGEQVVAYFANTCHAPDIGGRLLSAEASEVYEEGLRLPVLKLFRAGELNETLLDIVRANVRTPDETVGDLYAQAACNDAGARALTDFLAEFRLASLDPLSDEILRRSEDAMRAAIRALPDGVFRSETSSDGFTEPVVIKVSVRIADEDIYIDFTGTSPESERGINVVLNYTHAYASFALKAAVSPDVPHNHGSFAPVHVHAPPGCILNCREPAPVASRHVIGHFLPSVILRALAQAGPSLIATGSDSTWTSVWRGRSRQQQPFTFTLFQSGGMGARAGKDGLSATGFPGGVAGVPAEVIETLTPLVLSRRELRTDSGGAGRSRGGLGQLAEMRCDTEDVWSVSSMADRIRSPASGLDGGGEGRAGALVLTNGQRVQPKTLVRIPAHEGIELSLPGGGGYGDPRQRAPEAVLDDVVNGYVSLEAAAADYGVAIRYLGGPGRILRAPGDYEIDWAATAAARTR